MSETPADARSRRVVAITGASNALGLGLMRELAADPRYGRIVAIDVVRPDFEHPRVQFVKVDLTLPNASKLVGKIFQRERVDALVHLVFLYGLPRNPAFAHELEAIGTMHLLDACSEAEVRKVVMRSTSFVYGARAQNPALNGEDQPLADDDDSFIADKVEGEKQVKQYAERHPATTVTVLRDAITVGPTARNFFLSLLRRGVAPVVMGYDPLFQLLHQEDSVRAYKLALDRDVPGAFNIVAPGQLRYSRIRELAGVRALPLPEPALSSLLNVMWTIGLTGVPPSYLPFLKYSCLASGDKARDRLGFVAQYNSEAAFVRFLSERRP